MISTPAPGSVSRSERAYRSLREMIMESALKPGDKLPEDTIGTHFGVSRTIIRAAIARLASEGLVEVGRTKSARVAAPGRDEAVEAFQVRRALEREVVRVLSKSWREEFRDPVEKHIGSEREAADSPARETSTRLGAEFHILLAELTGNALLHRYVSEVVSRCTLILAVFGQDHPQSDSIREHESLLEAMSSGDHTLASSIVDEHIGSVQTRALARVDTGERSLEAILSEFTRRS